MKKTFSFLFALLITGSLIARAENIQNTTFNTSTGKQDKVGLLQGNCADNQTPVKSSGHWVCGTVTNVSVGDVTGPGTNHDSYVPKWTGANSKALSDGLAVGTSASNLLQLNGSAQIPAVDGSLLTGLTKSQVGLSNVTNNAQVTNVTGTSPIASSGGTTPAISIQTASGSQAGALSSTDWTTFNNKQSALTFTGNGSKVATSTGTLTSGHCVQWDANGNATDAGAACGSGGGGSGTITAVGDITSGDAATLAHPITTEYQYSPNGCVWSKTLDNAGTLVTTQISCPGASDRVTIAGETRITIAGETREYI